MVVVFSGGGTGGHLYPALALAQALEAVRPDVSPFFVGAERGIEARILPERGLPHELLPVEGLRAKGALGNVVVVGRLVRAVVRLLGTFRKLAPEAVVLTGGYASAPAGIAGALMGVPVVVQEQNELPGVTTRLVARWARQIHLAFPGARRALPERLGDRVRDTGNPIRPPVPRDREGARRAFGLPARGSVVVIVGGSQGSEALNRLVLEAIRDGSVGEESIVLWATGPRHFDAVQAELPEEAAGSVRLVPYLDDMYAALAIADLAISRAGAMTTSEFQAWGVPAILVPLPTAAADHQTKNAEALARAGVAVHLPQEGLTGRRLWAEVRTLLESATALPDMRSAALARARPDAARDIAAAVAELLPAPAGPQS